MTIIQKTVQEIGGGTSRESIKIRFEFTVFNLLNSSIVTNKYTDMLHDDYGQLQFANETDVFKGFNTLNMMKAQGRLIDPQYNLANGFQGPRTTRLQLSFIF